MIVELSLNHLIQSSHKGSSVEFSLCNEDHLHSGIKFITPSQRHKGLDENILKHRNQVYLEAKRKNPLRWSGRTRNWEPIKDVLLNPEKGKNDRNLSVAV